MDFLGLIFVGLTGWFAADAIAPAMGSLAGAIQAQGATDEARLDAIRKLRKAHGTTEK